MEDQVLKHLEEAKAYLLKEIEISGEAVFLESCLMSVDRAIYDRINDLGGRTS